MAILYKANETQFNHLGLGPLNDAVSILVTEERNGIFELEMKYPVSGKLFKELNNDRLIKADAGHKLKDQRFKIIRISKPLKGIVTVYAEHVSYLTQDLALKPKVTFSGNARQALEHWKANLVDDNPLTVWSDISTVGKINWSIDEVENARRALGGVQGSILDVYGGEYQFDNYDIYLYQKRGVNSALLIAYGRNLVDLEQEEEIANTYTSIYPYSIYTDDDGNERMVTLSEYYIDSEHVDKYARRKILVVDFTTDEIETVSALRSAARRYIKDNDVGVPRVNLKIQYIDLAKTLDYKHLALYEEVNLCDNVMIYFEKYDINTTAKVIKVVWDVLNERYDSIEVGEARASLSQAIDTVVDDKVQNVEKLAMQTLRTADGKNTIYFGLEEPTGDQLKENDIWYRIVDGEFTRTYRYDGVVWELIIDMDSQEAKEEARQAQERADGAVDRANQATQQATNAITQAQTAFDEAQDALGTANNAMTQATSAINQAQAGFDLAQESLSKSDDAFKKAQTGFDMADDAFKKAQENATHIDRLALRITGRNLLSHDRDRWLYNKITDNWQSSELIKIDDGTVYTISNYSVVPLNVKIHLYDGYTYTRSFDFTNDPVTFTTNKEDRYVIVVDYADDDFLDLLGTNIKFKLEKGEVATEWTIHDVDPYKQFTTITATVDGLQTTVSDVQGNVSSLTQLSNAMQAQLKDVEGNVNTLTLTSQSMQSTISSLQDDWDNLEIGGRNLLRDSNDFSQDVWKSFDNGTIIVTENVTVEEWGATDATKVVIGEGNRTSILKGFKNIERDADTVEGETYTVSLYVKNLREYTMSVRINGLEHTPIVHLEPHESKRVVVTDKRGSSYFQLQFRSHHANYRTEFIVWRAQVEKGTVATDWSPAPEDIDRNFSEITQKIDSITTRVGDTEGNITALQQTSSSLAGRLSDAEGNLTTLTATVDGLQTSVSDIDNNITTLTQIATGLQTQVTDIEGNLTTLQQTSNSLAGRLSDAEGNLTTLTATVDGLQTTVSDIDGNVSSLTQLSTTLQSRLSDAEGNINTLTLTSQSLVSKIENIGGSNLNRDSNNFNYNLWAKYDGGTYAVTENVVVEEWGATDATQVRAGAGDMTSVLKIFKSITSTTDTVEGETYTISFYVKNMRDREMSVNVNGILPRPTVSIGANEAKRVVVTGERSTASLQLQFRSYGVGYYTEFIVWRAQVEKGTVATDWQPAYEDTYSQITQLSDAINLRVAKGDVINQINLDTSGVMISGKKLILDGDTTVTGQFKVDNANIKSIDAGKVTVGDLVGHSLVGGSVIGGYIEQQSGNRRLEMYNGIIDSFYNGQLAMRFGQYSLEFYNRADDPIGRITPVTSISDPDRKGMGLIVDNDILNIGFRKAGAYRPILRTDFVDNNTDISGPYNGLSTGSSLRLFANRRQVSVGRFTSHDQPAIILDQSDTSNDVSVYFGGYGRRADARTIFRNRTSSTTYRNVLELTQTGMRVRTNYLRVGESGSGDPVFRANAIRRRTSTNDANVRINPDSNSDGLMYRTTSSEKQKVNIQSISYEHALKVLNLTPSSWYDKSDCETYAEYLTCGDRSLLSEVEHIRRIPGLIAEDVERAGLHEFVEYANDEIVNINNKLWTLLIPIARQHHDDIKWLKIENQYLRQKIKILEEKVS